MKKLSGAVLAALLLASCQSSDSDKAAGTGANDPYSVNVPAGPVADSSSATTTAAPTVAADTSKSLTVTGATLPSPPPPAVTSAVPVASKGAKGALNPAHGQPGHRCDIAVGAPLSSPAAAAPQPVTITPPAGGATPTVVAQPSTARPATAAPAKGARLNPAHGQPGHDCAVPVGQPLKS
ncbi:hypothetical protein [Flaviaesturariibacter amylovorans]|uniref:Uncharacterized protein n=1 Tax=Flaviaesturariibacter amylovorans TaxID=1084520 RepID=A0ABP8G6W8_9BACT